ncbi:MAG: DUF5011 domain-containing protein [Bacilli bacterium]|nr:DUF5011 domain-containing protein [Bacilli bacterium]
MKKYFNYFLFIYLILMPVYVKAAGSYSVEMVSGSSNNKVIGSYNTYTEALNSMNNQSSNNSVVATIFRNGVPVDSKYAIFKFKPSGNSTFPLYRNANSSSSYTSINTSYVGDAAVLGYSDNGRVKIMVSGFTGWINVDAGVVTPISLLGSSMININGTVVRLRSDHSTSSNIVDTLNGNYNFNYTDTYKGNDYTWYKINYNGKTAWAAGGDWVTVYNSNLSTYYNHYGPTGNLIHHFTVYSGGKYTDSFTNLGKAPSYLTKDVYYYSFDGNYFYNDITSMLDDYRSGIYSHSINSNNPHYSYYLYLTSRSTSGYSASDLDSIIVNNGYNSSSKMYATGSAFKEAEEKYGTNALLAFATALNESAWGMSSIAQSKNNLFGYGASDSCPSSCAYSYNSPKDSIMDFASKSSTSYETVSGKYYYGSHYGNKSSGKNIMYATDPYWGEKMAAYAYTRDLKFGGKDFNSNTIGVTKKGVNNVVVYKDASTNSPLYTMKNSKSGDPVYDFTANVIDKVNINGVEFYKIYTDLARDQEKYGYVLAKDFNVSNTQPVINAKDIEIKIGQTFDYMSGVTASDKENGDLTSKITYEGVVDTSKEGNYTVTYSTVDNSNFHVSKKINVKVYTDDEVKIEANDREILQYSKFDYLEGVKAYNNKGNVELTYEGEVDTSKEGNYTVTYKASNITKKVTIKVIKNEKPIIEAKDITININDEFNYLEGVSATDKEDGNLEVSYEGEVDTSKAGEYKISYNASDKEGQKTIKEITLTVLDKNDSGNNSSSEDVSTPVNPVSDDDTDKEVISDDKINDEIEEDIDNLEEKNGLFYLDYIKNVEGKLQIKGYNTIEGIDNNLETEIKYYIAYTNIDTEDVIIEEASRITDKNKMTKSIYSLDGKDYTYSWFKMDIDFSSIPFGNYIMCVFAVSDDSYSYNIINNKLNKTLDSSFTSSGKNIAIRRNYSYEGSPIEFVVRNSNFVKKSAGTYYNQFDKYTKFEFTSDSKLHLKGVSYSYGANLASGSNVSRKIIFENTDDYKAYYKDLGSITNGNYNVVLPENDNLEKTRAWYDANVDLSDLPKGHYLIYITTSSNVVDVYEMTEKLGRSLDNVKASINGKNYSFTINKNRGNRIELDIK